MATKAQNQITIVDLTDAYSVMLSMDAAALNGGVSTLGSSQSVTVYVSAWRGAEQLTPTVGTPSCPTNVSASVGSASNSRVPVTITFAAALSAAGKVTIPVTVDDVTVSKEFSYAIAFTGATGATGGKGDKGDKGDTGATGGKGDKGDKGDAGNDAILIAITTNNGVVFKNSSGSTTLTAHVYKGGVELTGSALSALGTVKWYKDGSSTAAGTGATLAVSAASVTDKAVYEARLEG